MTANRPPNVVLVVADDLGFSDLGCYGGEIDTPNLDALALDGVRFSSFYNTARCSPSRASLLTGLHPHQAGVGILNDDDRPAGYLGRLNDECVTLPELLGLHGYRCYMSGKWHLSNQVDSPDGSWPTRRGFDSFYGIIQGATSYFHPHTLTRDETNIGPEALDPDFYLTDTITDHAVSFVIAHESETTAKPFFLYVAYTAPHWPLQALEDDIARYRSRYRQGWDRLRNNRISRLRDMGLIDPRCRPSERDPLIPAWESADEQEWQAERMAVYAAQVDRMDQGVGRIVAELQRSDLLDNTIFIFLSDNGGSAEEIPEVDYHGLKPGLKPLIRDITRDGRKVDIGNRIGLVPGAENTYSSYGRCWANLSNAPFREYKHWVHEGGIATPMILHWPARFSGGGAIHHGPHQLSDVMATIVDAVGAEYPRTFRGRSVLPLEGVSMLDDEPDAPRPPRPLYWEHEGNAALRFGAWKLVRKYQEPWELYDVVADRSEQSNVAAQQATVVEELSALYEAWALRCGVIPYDRIVRANRHRGVDRSGTD